jgi:hypothetical protein
MAAYALYLDDIRHPPHTGDHWILCRSVSSMRELLEFSGVPFLASFDYELGRTDPSHTGYDALSGFLDFLLDHPVTDPVNIEIRFHTSSSHGAARMAQLLQKRSADCEKINIHLYYTH